MKTCAECGKTSPIEEFAFSARSDDGRTKHCAACRQRRCARQRKSYTKHRARRIAEVVEWRAKNAARVREYDRAHYSRHRDRKCEQKREALLRAKSEGRTAADRITDSYIANVWKMSVDDIPAPLIDAQRAHLQLKRLLKDAKP